MDTLTIIVLGVLVIIGVAFPTSCIWLAVRISNRGERWERVTAVCLLGLAIYFDVMIFGPIVWMVLLQASALAIAAFTIWLTVRIVNRRERWAKRTEVGLLAVLLAYPLSFGPVCWLNSQPVRTTTLRRPPLAMMIYVPLGKLVSSDTVMGHALMWWVHVGLGRERCTVIPTSLSDLGELSYSE